MLLVTHPSSIQAAQRRWRGGAVAWCYFGTHRLRRAAAARRLGGAARLEIGPELTQVARAAKAPFLDWLAEVECLQRDPAIWSASTFASPSPLETDLFLLVCYTRLLAQWEQSERARPRLVVVEDPWLFLTLRRQFRGSARVDFVGGERLSCALDALRWCARMPRVAVGNLRRIASSVLGNPARSAEPTGRRLVLIHTWVVPQCFSGRHPSDPWTGRLDQLLQKAGFQVARLSPLSLPRRLAGRLTEFGVPWIAAPRYVRLADVAQALRRWCRLDGLARWPLCDGWDYRPLAIRALLREWGEGHFMHYFLSYLTMRRIARQWGARVASIVYPFENQPWEKLLCLAWRAEAPHVRLIGYQHSWLPPLLVQCALGRGQAARAPLPDQIVASSRSNLAQLRANGFPEARLATGGALRYEYLHARESTPAACAHHGTVLVALPLSAGYAGHLVEDLLEAVKRPVVIQPDIGCVSFLIKCHPSLPAQRLGVKPEALPPWVRFSQEPLAALLPMAALLLYVGPTTSAWEAVARGVPVLAYQTDLVDLDGGWSADGFEVPRCSRSTLRAAIVSLLREGASRQRPAPDRVGHLFGPVEEETWLALVGGRLEPVVSA